MLYITFNNWADEEQYGVNRKVLGQVKAFAQRFGKVYVTKRFHEIIYLMFGDVVLEKEYAGTRSDYIAAVMKWAIKYHITKAYIRYPYATHPFVCLLRNLKDRGIKLVLELPGYPYEGELVRFEIAFLEDQIYRKEILKYIDRVALIGSRDKFLGMETTYIFNGLDMDCFPAKKKSVMQKNEVVLISVSSMIPTHGYERLIYGLKEYYDKNDEPKVRIFFVGTGSQEEYYKKLVSDFNLKKYVDFYGFQKGDVLNALYDKADIAIGALGGYKEKTYVWDTLKNAEYCAHGLPIVYSHIDMRFPKGTPFVLQVPDDDSSIDIKSVLRFYGNLKKDEKMNEKIYSYAKEKLSWDYSMKPILDFFSM